MQHSIHFDTRMIRAITNTFPPEHHVSKTNQQSAPMALSSYCFLIYDKILWNRNCCCSPTDWKPCDRVLVVKRPRRDNREERERGAAESNVDGELDVLQEVSDEEGDDLDGRC